MEYHESYQRAAEVVANVRDVSREMCEGFRQSLGLTALILMAGCYALTPGGREVPDSIPPENRERWRELRDQELAIMRQQDAGKELTADEDRAFQALSRARGKLED